ncbi:MAG: signal transduction histidine kinase [Candidatus Paceibacteria bacterium]|jgi:signal transduction histidine kinase
MGGAMTSSTLFRRLLARFLLGLGIAALVFTALVHTFQVRVVDHEWRKELHQEAVWLARHTTAAGASMLAGAWNSMHSSVRVTFFDVDGEQVADSHPDRGGIDLAKIQAGQEPRGQLAVAAELARGGTLVMSRSYSPSFPSGMRWELVAAILLIVGPMIWLLYPLVRSMSSTLLGLVRMSQAVASGHFGDTLPTASKDELGTLVNSFNNMSERLAEADRLNSRLLHDVSHELRSPLGRIQVLADTVAVRPQETGECLRGIDQEVGLLDRLVGDLLQAARLDSEQPKERLESFSIQHWATETFRRLERSALAKGAAWSSLIPEDDLEVRGDPQHLFQAFANVVDNALNAFDGQPSASIAVSVDFDAEYWVLTVADNGPGIPEEHVEHVFRRFYRVHEHRDREAGGVGLGLSMVQSITKAHGGSTTMESQVGSGTTITMRMAIEGGA